MPTPLLRFWRAPARAVAVGLVAATLLSSALLQSAASAALQQSTDDGERGLYDILVTATDTDAKGAKPATLLAPNSLYTGDNLLAGDDVEAIRALDGVEVAAPIAQVIVPGSASWRAVLVVPVEKDLLVAAPEDYRLTMRLVGNDGTGERLISDEQYSLLLDRANLPNDIVRSDEGASPPSSCMFDDVELPCELLGYSYEQSRTAAWVQSLDGTMGSQSSSDGETIRVSLPSDINLEQRITLIDPVAERALLGSAGAFLDPLVTLGGRTSLSVEELRDWAGAQQTTQSDRILEMGEAIAKADAEFFASPAYLEYARIKRERGEEPDGSILSRQRMPVVPLLIADTLSTAPVRAELLIEGFGPRSGFSPDDNSNSYQYTIPAAIRAGSPGAPLPALNEDVSSLLSPFANETVSLLWPGTVAATEADTAQNWWNYGASYLGGALGVRSLTPTSVGTAHDGTPTAELESVGFRQLRQAGEVSATQGVVVREVTKPMSLGAESVFGVVRRGEPSMSLNAPSESGVAVGGFGEAELKAITELADGLPLGAYAPPSTTLVEDVDGRAIPAPGTSIRSFSSMGLGGDQSSAIADITNEVWRNKQRVDAVRVRVAGVGAYDAAGIHAVTQTARAIEQLGYTATIVAGSSRETVRVAVGDFVFGTMDADGVQRVGDLGVVEQQWTLLGAAANAGNGVSVATQLLIGTVLLGVLGLFALTESAQLAVRRREASVLRSIGWRRSRITRWFAAEQAIAMLLVVASGAVALLIAREQALTATLVGISVLVCGAITVWSLITASRVPIDRAASVAELERIQSKQRRPELRVLAAEAGREQQPYGDRFSDERTASATPVAREARRSGPRKLPSSPLRWGMQRAWRRRRASFTQGLAIVLIMATVAAFTATITGVTGGVPVGSFGTILPQLLLAVCGITAGLVLIVALCARLQRERATSDAVLDASGWAPRDKIRAARAESLSVSLVAVLVASYALWFVMGSLGLNPVHNAVTAALVSGLLAAALFLETTFATTPRSTLDALITRITKSEPAQAAERRA